VVYAKGYEAPHAITLAHLASYLVDAQKAGLRLRKEKWSSLLTDLKVVEPEYMKSKGVDKRMSRKVMDVLVLDVIPSFREEVLASFNEHVGRDESIPIDADIKAFYDAIVRSHPELVTTLKQSLLSIKTEWEYEIGKIKNGQNKTIDDTNCSPRKRVKRTNSAISKDSLVTSF